MIDLKARKEKQRDLVSENTEHRKVKTKQKTVPVDNEENERKPTKKSKKTAKRMEQNNEDCNDRI